MYKQRRNYLDLWPKLQELASVTRMAPFQWDPALFQEYSAAFHDVKGQVMRTQKRLRSKIVQGTRGPSQARNNWNKVALLIPGLDPVELDRLTTGLPTPERIWRFQALSEWDRPLRQRERDGRMFPNPALRASPIEVRDFAEFWFTDVNGDAVSITRLVGLVVMHQLDYEVTSGNIVDLHHAIHLLDCDAVLTGDGPFAKAMQDAVQHLLGVGKPIFVPKACGGVALDPVQAILDALDAA